MVTEEDCSCADTTEPSNLTSLRSDDATSAINSDINVVCTEMIDERIDTVEKPKGILPYILQTFHESKLYVLYKVFQNQPNIFLTADFLVKSSIFLSKISMHSKESY